MEVDTVSSKQISKIWAMASGLSINKEELYSLLMRETKKTSMRKCSKYELNRVIEVLNSLENGANSFEQLNRITEKQIYKIREIEKELGWSNNPNRLKAFLKKYYKVEKLEWLQFEDASKLIESLKALRRRVTK